MNTFSDLDLYYMNTGEHTSLYEKMGAHLVKERNKILGTQFRVYAPNAQEVFLVGNFNDWSKNHPMSREQEGIFSLYVENLKSLENYKYLIEPKTDKKFTKPIPLLPLVKFVQIPHLLPTIAVISLKMICGCIIGSTMILKVSQYPSMKSI